MTSWLFSSLVSGASDEARDLGAGTGNPSDVDFLRDDLLELSSFPASGLDNTLLLAEMRGGLELLLFLGDWDLDDLGDFGSSTISAIVSSFLGVFLRNGFEAASNSSMESSTLTDLFVSTVLEKGLEVASRSSTELSSLSGIDFADREDFRDFGLSSR